MSQFWQNLQVRLHPAVPNESTGVPGRKWLSGFFSIGSGACRAFSPHARAKKLARAAECLVYSLTPSGFLGGKPPKNRGFVAILRGQKCLRRRFLPGSPVGEVSRGAPSMPRIFGRGSPRPPAPLVLPHHPAHP